MTTFSSPQRCIAARWVSSTGSISAPFSPPPTEVHRGKMGILNWVGDRLLWLAHQGRPNTISGGCIRAGPIKSLAGAEGEGGGRGHEQV